MVWVSLPVQLSNTSVQVLWQKKCETTQCNNAELIQARQITAVPMHRDTPRENVWILWDPFHWPRQQVQVVVLTHGRIRTLRNHQRLPPLTQPFQHIFSDVMRSVDSGKFVRRQTQWNEVKDSKAMANIMWSKHIHKHKHTHTHYSALNS